MFRRSVMLTAATSWMTVAAMLVCPYFCMGQALSVGRSCDQAVAAAGTDCCCSAQDGCDLSGRTSSESVPRPVDEADPDCVCHGAVLQAGEFRSAVMMDQMPPSMGRCTVFRWEHPDDGSDGAVDSQRSCRFPAAMSGREICLRAGLLLI